MRIAIVLVLLCACSGDKPPEVDADPRGPRCTHKLYDLCESEHDCDNGICKLFMQEGFMVCTTSCTPGDDTTCMQPTSGATVTCNNMGICKPSAPNMCHL